MDNARRTRDNRAFLEWVEEAESIRQAAPAISTSTEA